METFINKISYQTELAGNSHWSLRMRRGTVMRLTDTHGDGNLAMLFYNPENLLERYNAPDTLKCQHTFKLTQGHCLYSDMGRIFASIVHDDLGWHDTVCGNSHANHVEQQWGKRDYQADHNKWHQNGHDAFLVELGKYGLGPRDLAANINWFNKAKIDEAGTLQRVSEHSAAGSQVVLRFEMDTLVLMHTCPHPLNTLTDYPQHTMGIEIGVANSTREDDQCRNHCDENKRGFANNELYHLGKT